MSDPVLEWGEAWKLGHNPPDWACTVSGGTVLCPPTACPDELPAAGPYCPECKGPAHSSETIAEVDRGLRCRLGSGGPLPEPRPIYVTIGEDIGQLVSDKQTAYGDSFGKSGAVLRILYPQGISLEALPDALTVVRVLDKLFRIATDRDALGESPWRDVAGYALLAINRVESARKGTP